MLEQEAFEEKKPAMTLKGKGAMGFQYFEEACFPQRVPIL